MNILELVTKKDEEKVKKLKEAMEKRSIDVLLFRLVEDVLYISGYWSSFGFCSVLFPLDGEPTIITIEDEKDFAERSWIKDVRYVNLETKEKLGDPKGDMIKIIKEWMKDRNLHKASLGYEGSMEFFSTNAMSRENWSFGISTYEALKKNLPEVKLIDATDLIYEVRSLKSEREVEIMKIVNEVADMGLEAFHKSLEEGKREIDLQAEVEKEVMERGIGYKGIERLVVFAMIMSGKNSAQAYKMYNVSTIKKLEKGDFVLMELNLNVEGYWSDTTRTYVVGKPNKEQEDIFDTALEAQERALEAIRDGVRASDINSIAFEVLKKRGYWNYITHRLGHGIGVNMHEPIPALHLASNHIIRSNMIFSVEPGIYGHKYGGIRIEDMVLSLKNKGERLNKYYRGA
ncbi:Xaa-Pro dipeptidase [archaeon HR06]|nr:Xaa-Pro dipeptidase [archaeon HR06]